MYLKRFLYKRLGSHTWVFLECFLPASPLSSTVVTSPPILYVAFTISYLQCKVYLDSLRSIQWGFLPRKCFSDCTGRDVMCFPLSLTTASSMFINGKGRQTGQIWKHFPTYVSYPFVFLTKSPKRQVIYMKHPDRTGAMRDNLGVIFEQQIPLMT